MKAYFLSLYKIPTLVSVLGSTALILGIPFFILLTVKNNGNSNILTFLTSWLLMISLGLLVIDRIAIKKINPALVSIVETLLFIAFLIYSNS